MFHLETFKTLKLIILKSNNTAQSDIKHSTPVKSILGVLCVLYTRECVRSKRIVYVFYTFLHSSMVPYYNIFMKRRSFLYGNSARMKSKCPLMSSRFIVYNIVNLCKYVLPHYYENIRIQMYIVQYFYFIKFACAFTYLRVNEFSYTHISYIHYLCMFTSEYVSTCYFQMACVRVEIR